MTKPKCTLVGMDGNAFAIISMVSGCLIRNGSNDLAKEFIGRAFNAGSYDEVLKICMEYVEVI